MRRHARRSPSFAAGVGDLARKPGRYYEEQRAEMLKYIPPCVRTTLEFGCGCGVFSALLKDRFGTESWAVEIEPAAAQEAARRLDRVIQADALLGVAQVPDHHFDCILFLDVLEHLVDPYRLLREVKAKLTPDGVVVASIPNIRYYRTLVKFVVHGEWHYEDRGVLDKTHLRFFTRKSIVRMFEQSGLRILTLEGLHPTSSRTLSVLNMILLNRLADTRHSQFAVVAAPG
jgi:2-polyprenyl-3-methyl-5-hydroxy-6-metoxy-1,4-benzoquinol methylase